MARHLARERLPEARQLGEVEVEVGAGEQLGDAAAAVGVVVSPTLERAAEVALDEGELGVGQQRAEQAERRSAASKSSVSVSRKHDELAGGGREAAPHRVALAERGAEGGLERRLRDRRRTPRSRATAAVPSRESASTTSSSSTSGVQRLERVEHPRRASPRPRAWGGSTLIAAVLGARAAGRAGSRRRRSCARPASALRRRSTASPRRARPKRRPGRGDAHGGEPLDRHAVAVQRALEALVLQRRARLQPADLRVGRGGHRQRGAAELVVLARAGGSACAARRCGGVGLAPRAARRAGGRARRARSRPPIARAPGRDGVELRAQPVRRGLGVGVGGGDQAVGRAGARRPGPCPGGARGRRPRSAASITCSVMSPAAARARCLGRVGAAVEHEQDLVVVAADARPGRRARAMHAPISSSSSRAGTTTHGAVHGSGALASISSRPRLVVLVALVREHADGRAFAAVPDRQRAAAVVDEARLVEAVAPRDVLERVLADRRPEAGRDVPLRVARRRSCGPRPRPC